jgi:8-oxo-dGTP pyrophosphatase MutT (NUDIX family)
MSKERNKIIPASYLVLIKDGKILMQRRFNTGFMDGYYCLVAGHVDKGENFTGAIIRETKEETGINLEPEDLKMVHIMHRDSRIDYPQGVAEGVNERVDAFFAADKWEGEIINTEPHKCDDLGWFDMENLPENTIPYVRQAINCIIKEQFYSEFGW